MWLPSDCKRWCANTIPAVNPHVFVQTAQVGFRGHEHAHSEEVGAAGQIPQVVAGQLGVNVSTSTSQRGSSKTP